MLLIRANNIVAAPCAVQLFTPSPGAQPYLLTHVKSLARYGEQYETPRWARFHLEAT